MTLKNATGWNIRRIRIQKGLTVHQLASALPSSAILSSGEVAEIEVGTRKVYDYELQAISMALGVSIERLFATPQKKVTKSRIQAADKSR